MLGLIQDLITGGKVGNDQLGRALEKAVTRYSLDRPLEAVQDVVADASTVLPLPTDWLQKVSQLNGLEYPIDLLPVAMLRNDEYALVKTPAGDAIRLVYGPGVGATVRVYYTLPHTVDTVPEADHEAVAHWAAALLCDQIAASMSNNSAPTIRADRVDYTNPAKEWRTRAKDYRARYASMLGIAGVGAGAGTGAAAEKPVTKAAGVEVALDLDESRHRGFLYLRGNRPRGLR